MLQAYILVNKAGFSYADIKKMTKLERASFLKFYKEDVERMSEKID